MIFFFLLILLSPSYAWGATVVETLAGALPANSWVELTAQNTPANLSLFIKSNGGNIAEFTNKGVYDSVGKTLYYCGTSHHNTFDSDCLKWSFATNAITSIGLPAGMVQGGGTQGQSWTHTYDHMTIDVTRRHLYMAQFNSRLVYRYDIAGATWSTLPTWVTPSCPQANYSLNFFPEIDRMVLVNSGCGADGFNFFNPATNTWTKESGMANFTGNGKDIEGTYSNQGYLYVGGGDGVANEITRRDTAGNYIKIATPFTKPLIISTVFAADPSSGRPYLFSCSSGRIDEYNPKLNTWSTKAAAGSSLQGSITCGAITPISDLGVFAYIRGNASSSVQVFLYRPYLSADGDFIKRSDGPGVLRAIAFDATGDLGQNSFGAAKGYACGSNCPTIDATIAASGAGSMKFTQPSLSGSSDAGSWWTTYSDNRLTQFGLNTTHYVQWRQRFSPEAIQLYNGGDGWKQSIIGAGDQAGCVAGGVSFGSGGQCAASCTALEVVNQMSASSTIPPLLAPYTGCGFNDFMDVTNALGNKLQSGYCYRPPPYFPSPANPLSGCWVYTPNEWITFTVEIKVGTAYNSTGTGSRLRFWAQRITDSSPVLVVDSIDGDPTGINLHSETYNGQVLNYGKVWLLPYYTGKDSAQVHAPYYFWYDELIVSSLPIPSPGFAAPIVVSPPASPTGLKVGGKTLFGGKVYLQ